MEECYDSKYQSKMISNEIRFNRLITLSPNYLKASLIILSNKSSLV